MVINFTKYLKNSSYQPFINLPSSQVEEDTLSNFLYNINTIHISNTLQKINYTSKSLVQMYANSFNKILVPFVLQRHLSKEHWLLLLRTLVPFLAPK